MGEAPGIKPSGVQSNGNPGPGEIRSHHYGDCLALDHVSGEIGLTQTLKAAFPNDYQRLLKLAFSMVSEGNSMSDNEPWQMATYSDFEDTIDDIQTDSIFASIESSQKAKFFEQWINKHEKDRHILYDVTAIQSYSKKMPTLELGYHGKYDNLQQLNLSMYYSHTSGVPIYYNTYQENLNNNDNLQFMVNHTKSLGLKDVLFVLDRCFYEDINLSNIINSGYNFIIPLPQSRSVYTNLLSKYRHTIRNNNNKINDNKVFGQKFDERIDGLDLSVHIFYDMEIAFRDDQQLYDYINTLKSDLEQLTNQNKLPTKFSKYFNKRVIKSKSGATTYEYELKNDKIDDILKFNGYFIFITSDKTLNPSFILHTYRKRDSIEKQFMVYKNAIEYWHSKTKDDDITNGKMFLQFISLILKSYIKQKINVSCQNDNLQKLSINNIMSVLKEYRIIHLNNNEYKTTLTNLQKDILAALGVPGF
jgi:transposase